MELRRIVASARALDGLALLEEAGAIDVVLPELGALRGVEQNRFHHLDVHGHTLEVLQRTIELTGDPRSVIDSERDARQVAALLAEPLADELTRAEALRWGALLHDAAKPLTRAESERDGRVVTFLGHDVRGAELARAVLGRLRASERLRGHVAALVRHHLRLGFLVHEPQPLSRRATFGYLRGCSPVAVDVTLLSMADRLATRGDRARESIQAHMALAQGVLSDALRWEQEGPPVPPLRGDELIAELGIAPGPLVARVMEGIAESQYAGELSTREQALALARELIRAER